MAINKLRNGLPEQKVRLYKIKHFIFDFGGVLIEKTFVLDNLFELIEHDLSIKIPQKDSTPFLRKVRRRLSKGVISAREFLNLVIDKYNNPQENESISLPPKQVNIEYYLELWFNLYTKVTKISSDVALLIDRLHQGGYIVSLMSNTYDIYARSNELRGFYELFDNVFLSNEIGLIKPDMDKYKHVLNKLGAKPKNCVFIDDKLRNLIPAHKLGIIVIKFESFEQFNSQLNELGISKIKPNLRKEITKRYEYYKKVKREYKKIKSEYKNAKKEYLDKKYSIRKLEKRREEFELKRERYKEKKKKYESEKRKKKNELESKVKLT